MNLTVQEKYWLWLSSVEHMGAASFYRIIEEYVDAKTACENFRDIPKRVKLTEKLRETIVRDMNSARLDVLLEELEKKAIKVCTRLNQEYPALLEYVDNPPPVLYVKGYLPRVDEMSCGIVGARKPTRTGFDAAKKIAFDLAAQGVVIVSGLARGIDSGSHIGALQAAGKTIAVLGCGVDVVYPPENRKLYNNIVESGAVVSEFVPGTQPAARNFPQRNRVIAGLSQVLIAGEGSSKSGARITVDYALKQGKEIYVLPFDMQSTVASLPIYLMQSGAPVVNDALDLMRDRGWQVSAKGNVAQREQQAPANMTADQQVVYALLSKEALSVDELCVETGIAIQNMNMLLTVMELHSMIEAMPGGRFRVNKSFT